MSLRERVIEFLKEHPAKKAREIAAALGEDKKEINSILYSERGKSVEQISGFRWRALTDAGRSTPDEQSPRSRNDTPLARLCRYYLACLAKDLDRNVSEFAASKYDAPNYAELESLPFNADIPNTIWGTDDCRRIIGRTRAERRKLSLVLGYPTRLTYHQAKSGWEGFFVEPLLVFEFGLESTAAPTLSDERPEINVRALRALTGQTGPELLDEVILLRQEMGIDAEEYSLDDFEDMCTALRELRGEWR